MELKNIIIGLLFATFTLSSCGKKCQECGDCPSEITLDESEICEDDFETKDEYNAAVALIEALGCECK